MRHLLRSKVEAFIGNKVMTVSERPARHPTDGCQVDLGQGCAATRLSSSKSRIG
jgi:hypothetical protein